MMRIGKTALWMVLGCDCALVAACLQPEADTPEKASEVQPSALGTLSLAINTSPTLEDFVLYASNSIALGEKVIVNGGDVGVTSSGPGPHLVSGYELAVGAKAALNASTNLIADSLVLRDKARVGDVQVNELANQGATHGAVSAFVALSALPSPSSVTPGLADHTVAANSTVTLPPGAYRKLTIGENARVRLTGGTYHLAELIAGEKGEIEALATTELRIAQRLNIGEKVYLGPERGSSLTARDLRLEVSGINGSDGSLNAQPPAAQVGEKAQLRGLVLVPNGRLTLGEKAEAKGAFFARDVDVRESAGVSFESGFAGGPSCPPSCDDGNPCTQDACVASACAHSAVAAGTSCADSDLCDGAEFCNGAGVCSPGTAVICAVAHSCQQAGACDPATGACSFEPKPDGSSCDDGTACTTTDVCLAGRCEGGNPVVCVALDECHEAGVCDPSSGACSQPIKPGSICEPLPPDPATVAPALDPGVAVNLADAAEFLYTGAHPIQSGVAPGTIERPRASVLHGEVRDRTGAPLPGVVLSIKDHPEFGSTRSREDGEFDLVVNGGSVVVVQYEKPGYLPAQRQVLAPWLDHARVPDAALVPLDPSVTTIDLSSNAPQVARGSLMIDESGPRRVTLLFKPGTQASMILQDCSAQPLDELNVRATEYTVGAGGPSAMPAALPPASAYTYAVELSVDEAIAAGATRVEFSQPVVGYLDNFLEFPTGTVVPFGHYDGARAEWVGAESGRVIEVLDSSTDLANLDTDGDGLADDEATLEALHVTGDERRFLKLEYAASTTLWRTETPHFSPWDSNWPIAPPQDASAPGQPPPSGAASGGGPTDEPDCGQGCTIEIQNQVLGESVDIAGTPFSLEYRSDRVLGKSTRSVEIPVSSASVPASLRSISLTVHIAGQYTQIPLSAAPNQRYSFVWDGKDGWGRPVQGYEDLHVDIGYNYAASYEAAPRFGYNGEGIPITGDLAREEVSLHQRYSVSLYNMARWDGRGQGLGGWSLNVHHVYDPQSKVLRLGSGGRRTVESLHPAVKASAGNGRGGFAGDGGPAKDASLRLMPCDGCEGFAGVAPAADGGFYIADVGNCRLRRVRADGIIETVAGTGTCDVGEPEVEPSPEGCSSNSMTLAAAEGDRSALDVDLTPIEVTVAPDGAVYIVSSPLGLGYGGGIDYTLFASKIFRLDPASGTLRRVAGNGFGGTLGEDIPATDAFLLARDVAVAPDGNIYIADTGHHRIRRVTPDGLIRTVAGDGNSGFEGDEGPAASARLATPTGVAVGPAGELFIADQGNSRVRRVSAEGAITTVVGGGAETSDGSSALDAALYKPMDLAVASNGSIYFAEPARNLQGTLGRRVRRLTPAGRVETVAGGGAEAAQGIGEPATDVFIVPNDVEVAPDGAILVEDLARNSIQRVISPLPGVGLSEMLIPSEGGEEIYVFDKAGRHQRTIHPLTGATLLAFGYDVRGLLVTVTDAHGNITSIQRGSAGQPLSVTGPYGHVTELGLDGNGYLSSTTNPAGETTVMTYDPEGLMTAFADRRGNTHRFVYDEFNRLIRDTNPAGDLQTFERAVADDGYRVTQHSPLGRDTSYGVDGLENGSRVFTNTFPDGTQTRTESTSDGSTVTQLADGSTTTLTVAPDPRFGVVAPLSSSVVQTPLGLSMYSGASRQVFQTDPENPLTIEAIQDDVYSGDTGFSRYFDAVSRTVTRTSWQGRQTIELLDELGRVVRRDIPGLATTFVSFDERGRLSSVARGTEDQTVNDGGPRITTFSYDGQGQLSRVTDPLGHVTEFADYDGAGRAQTQILPGDRTVEYGYDGNSNIISIAPPDRPAHVMEYTATDLMSLYEPPEPISGAGGTWSTAYEHNADKDLELLTRPDGVQVDYGYDPAGRLTSLSYPSPTLPATDELATLGYDSAGRLATMTSGSGVSLAFGYDGPLLTSETWSGPVSGSVERSYDGTFRLSGESVNGQSFVDFQYDYDSLLTRAGAISLGRDPSTGLLTSTFLEGTWDSFSYNAFGELDSYFVATPAESGAVSVSYERDQLGRITQKSEVVTGVPVFYTFGYDEAGRLETVTRDGLTTSYRYDANGNRLSKTNADGTVFSAIYDDQDRLLSYADASYTYTDNGELLTKTTFDGTTQYTYDALGNLRLVALPDGTVIEYVVDAQNRRVGKKVDGALVQTFIYANGLSPIAEFDGAGNLVSRFVYGTRVNVPEYMIRDGVTYRFVTDHLGSPRLIVDAATGTIAQQLEYDEWGIVLSDTNPGFTPFGFAGGLYEEATGLVRFGARDYDAVVGRWTAKDPQLFLFTGETNLFAYVFGNPVNFIDPSGRAIFGEAADAALSLGTDFADAPSTSEGLLAVAGAELGLAGGGYLALSGPVAAIIGSAFTAASIGMSLYEIHLNVKISQAEFDLRMLKTEQELLEMARARDVRCRSLGYQTNFLKEMLRRLPVLRRFLQNQLVRR